MTIDKPSPAGRSGNVRWLMVVMAFLIAAVAYLDRANISIAASFIKSDFSIDNKQLGLVFSAFTLGYALTQPIAGRLSDRFGAYRIMAVGIFLWCVLTALTALIPAHLTSAFTALLLVRLALGAGESMLFPASNKLISNWVPTQERGLANGIVFAGVGIGSGIAPPLITAIMLAYDWRAAFWCGALLGLVAMAAWLWLVRERPEIHRGVGAAELTHIKTGLTGAANRDAPAQALPWRAIIFNRNTALLNLGYFCYAYVAYIFFTWFFTYLSTVRGLNLKASGWYATLPFIAMAICSPLGGWIADGLTARWGKRVGRCLFASFGMALAAVFVAAATQVADARLAVVVLAGGSGALYLAQSAFWALSADMGRGSAGSVSGLMNMFGQLGGTLVAAITPWLADYLGWEGSFLFTAGVALIGSLAWLPLDPNAQITVPASRTD